MVLDAQDVKGQSASQLKTSGEVGSPNVGSVDTNGSDYGGTQDPKVGQRTLTAQQRTVQGVAIAATNRDDIETYSAAIAGGSVGVAVAAAVNVINTDTQAYIGNGASVNGDQSGANAAQSVTVAAVNDFHHVALAAGAGFGAVGVAPGVDVTVLSGTTTASIGSGASVKAKDDVTVDAHASEDILLIGMGIAAGTVGVGGGVSVLSISNTTTASILGSVSAGGDAAVRASDDTKVLLISGALGAGFVGVGASVGVMVIGKETSAFIGNGASVDAAGGGVGSTPDVLTGTLQDTNSDGNDADDFARGSRNGVIVQAESGEQIVHVSVAAGFGFVGVSGAVGVSIIDSDTKAFIGDADVNQTAGITADADQSVHVGAANEARMITFSGAIAGGFVGVGGAVYVGVLKNDVNAQILDGARVSARNDVEVNALGIKDIDGFVISGAGGFVGVAASVSVWSIGEALKPSYSDNGENAGSTADDKSENALEKQRVRFDANATTVDTSANNIDVGDQRDLRTGEKVKYRQGASTNTSIGGLVDDGETEYFVRVEGGRIALYDTKEHALTGGSTGRVNLTGTGSGNKHSFTQTSDEDAAQQGENASGMVSGELSGFESNVENRGDGKATTNERLADITNKGASEIGKSPTAADISLKLADIPQPPVRRRSSKAAHGSRQAIRSPSTAAKIWSTTSRSAASPAGFVGVGAAVSVASVTSNSSAVAGGTLVAGGELTVEAELDEHMDALSIAGGAGFVGIGASVVVIENGSSTTAKLLSGTSVNDASAVNVLATSTQKISALTIGAATGAGATGASFTRTDIHGKTVAEIGNNAQLGQEDAIGSMTVAATSTIDADTRVFAAAVGGVAVSFNFAFIDATPEVRASVGAGVQVDATGDVTVAAVTSHDADGKVFTFTAGGGRDRRELDRRQRRAECRGFYRRRRHHDRHDRRRDSRARRA